LASLVQIEKFEGRKGEGSASDSDSSDGCGSDDEDEEEEDRREERKRMREGCKWAKKAMSSGRKITIEQVAPVVYAYANTNNNRGIAPCLPRMEERLGEMGSLDGEGWPGEIRYPSVGYVRVFVGTEIRGRTWQVGIQAEQAVTLKAAAARKDFRVRVVEGEGRCREWTRTLDGNTHKAHDWGKVNIQERRGKGLGGSQVEMKQLDYDVVEEGGYQGLELMRLCNKTSLCWVAVDPDDEVPGTRVYVKQPECCDAEMLFYEGGGKGQVTAIRGLMEAEGKGERILGVERKELAARVLGDCLRGNAAHTGTPHCPEVRAEAAKGLAQWMINRNVQARDSVGRGVWLGLELLLKYYEERGGYSEVVHGVRGCTLEFKWEEDEEYKVKAAAVTSISCIRARDGQTPQKALDFLLKVLKSRAGERCGAPAVPPGCPLGFKEMGDRMARDMDLSVHTAENYLACCYVNISKTEVLPGIRHPVLGLMEECHGRLELELFLQMKREEEAGEGRGGGCDVTEAPVATSCITALSTLAILKSATEAEVGAGAGAGGSGTADEGMENELEKMLKAELIAQYEKEDCSGPMRKIIVDLMLDCITGKICVMQRAAIMTNGKYDHFTGMNRCLNGPLGASHGDMNGNGVLTNIVEKNSPAAFHVNNGARAGFRLMRKAGGSREFGSRTVARAAKVGSKLWDMVIGKVGMVWGLEGGGNLDSDHKVNLDILWGWLFNPAEKGCPALKCAWEWLKDPAKEAQNREKLGLEGIKVWGREDDQILVEELKKLAEPVQKIEREEEEIHDFRMKMASKQQEILKTSLGSVTREAYDILNICRVSDDTRWKQGGWAGSVAVQR
ncbi:hypothetical protein TrRE_jg7319, partial [Triparma retinervis]